MNGFGKQLENFGRAGESVERMLDAIRFQTAILTLNAALEAAQMAKPGVESMAIADPVRNAKQAAAGRAASSADAIPS
ncbi:MAG: hypothetical protein WCB12_03230 [Bryobacteraceae bacterium]